MPVVPSPHSDVVRPGLCTLLAATAHADPSRVAFIDPKDKVG